MKPRSEAPSLRLTFVLAALIALAALVAYHNSFRGVFVFDDDMSIRNNPSIRHLSDIGALLNPPVDGGRTVGGRPILNVTLALNYALGGTAAFGYHAVNLAIHAIAALLLFGIVRRTLGGDRQATRIGFFAATLWAVHPLQTEAVTYVVQRAESLMGLFYFLTLYAFIRFAGNRAKGWAALSIAACFLGMGTKEVMVSAPLIVFLYDAVFIGRSAHIAWRARPGYYLALVSSWVPLGLLVLAAHGRGGSSGFGTGVSWAAYVLTQPGVILHYLGLCLWPAPLVFDYGVRWVPSFGSAMPAFLLVAGIAAASLWALIKKPSFGFLGVWFFAILAPTSLIPGARMTMADHRMYLALAPLAVFAALGLAALPKRAAWAGFILAAGILTALTIRRNDDYTSELRIWTDSVAKRPENLYARENLGGILFHEGHPDQAIEQYQEALKISANYPEAENNWGMVLASEGKNAEAIGHYEKAIALKSNYPEAYNNLGIALSAEGKASEAEAKLKEALRLKPDYPQAENNLGLAYARDGRWEDAISRYQAALASDPGMAEAESNLGLAYAYSGRVPEALIHFEKAEALDPNNAQTRNALGTALRSSGKSREAVAQYEAALKLQPDFPDAAFNLGNALTDLDSTDRAIASYQLAVRLRPDYAEANYNLGLALAEAGRPAEAIQAYQSAVRSRPDYAEAHRALAHLYLSLGRMPEAASELEAAGRTP